MKSTLSIFIIVLLMLTSCADENKKLVNDLHQKVMDVHDEVMPKMGALMKYKKDLKTKVEELTTTGLEENKDKIVELTEAIEALDNSHEDMMSWMREFDNDFEGKVHEDVMEYLNDQMNKIEGVGKATNEAIKRAEALMAE